MISYRHLLSPDQFIQHFSSLWLHPFSLFYCTVILINSDFYHIPADVIHDFQLRKWRDKGKKRSQSCIVNISGETKDAKLGGNKTSCLCAGECLSRCQSSRLKDRTKSWEDAKGFNVKARTLASVDDKTAIHRAACENKTRSIQTTTTPLCWDPPIQRLPASQNPGLKAGPVTSPRLLTPSPFTRSLTFLPS